MMTMDVAMLSSWWHHSHTVPLPGVHEICRVLFSRCLTVPESVRGAGVVKEIVLRLGAMPGNVSRMQIVRMMDDAVAMHGLQAPGYYASAVTLIHDALTHDNVLIQKNRPSPAMARVDLMSADKTAAIPNLRQREDAARLVIAHPHIEAFVLSRYWTDGWEALWTDNPREALSRLLREYAAEHLPDHEDPAYPGQLMETLESSPRDFSLQQACDLLCRILKTATLDCFDKPALVMFWAAHYCHVRLQDQKTARAAHRRNGLFDQAGSGGDMTRERPFMDRMFTPAAATGIAPMHNTLRAPDSLVQLQSLIQKSIPSFPRWLTHEIVLRQLGHHRQGSSFLYWLCTGTTVHHAMLLDILTCNQVLFHQLTDVIGQVIKNQDWQPEFADVMWLARLASTKPGQTIIHKWSLFFQVPVEELLHTIRYCQPPGFAGFLRECNTHPHSQWPELVRNAPDPERAGLLVCWLQQDEKNVMNRTDSSEDVPFLYLQTDLADVVMSGLPAHLREMALELLDAAYRATIRTDGAMYGLLTKWLERADSLSSFAGLLRATRESLLERNPQLGQQPVIPDSTASSSRDDYPPSSLTL